MSRGLPRSLSSPIGGTDNRVNILSQESQSLNNSLKMVDDTLAGMEDARIRIKRQDDTMATSSDRISQIISGIPYIGDVANKIHVKRKRDRLILGSLIGFLMFVIVWYLFG